MSLNYGRSVVLRELDALGIELGPEGAGGWAPCLCPLHEDSKPSFAIKADAGAWMCRSGCGKGSDLAELIERITQEPAAQARRRMLLGAADDPEAIARAWSEPAPAEPPASEPLWYEVTKIPRYILQRGFTQATCKRWKIGYDGDIPAVVIPIYWQGELTGLIRRRITPGEPRYQYTWGLEKSEILFGLDMVPKDKKRIVVVEGPLDCIWLHQNGYPAVAILGSAMSSAQADLLRQRFWEIYLAFDRDDAGFAGMLKARALLAGADVGVVALPTGVKDVQECAPELLKSIFASARSGWYSSVASGLKGRAKFYLDSANSEPGIRETTETAAPRGGNGNSATTSGDNG